MTNENVKSWCRNKLRQKWSTWASSRNTAQVMAFAWMDTRQVRSPDAQAYAILNDSDRPIPQSILDAMRNYDVRPVVWSDREETREELAA